MKPAVFKEFGDPDLNGRRELSINWYDDDGAVVQILNQRHKTEDRPLYLGGAVFVRRYRLDELRKHAAIGNRLQYERARIEGNEYHGNLLFIEEKGSDNKTMMSMICSHLALFSERMDR